MTDLGIRPHVDNDCDCDDCILRAARLGMPDCDPAISEDGGFIYCRTHGYTVMAYADGWEHDEPFDPWAEDAGYRQHLRDMEDEEHRARERRSGRVPMPHRWGERLSDTTYFCSSCWLQGDETGAHPFDQPPCDPIPRRDI